MSFISAGDPWLDCLSLAMEASAAGSLGIASVIATNSGEIVARGRNQLFDDQPSRNVLRNNLVAHAEMNALASLPHELRRDKALTLYTTVEPCSMCIGAIAMSPIRRVRAATRDPWAGGTGLLSRDDYLGHKNILVEIEGGVVEEVFFLIHLMSQRKRNDLPPGHPFFAAMERAYPELSRRLPILEGDSALAAALSQNDPAKVLDRIAQLTSD